MISKAAIKIKIPVPRKTSSFPPAANLAPEVLPGSISGLSVSHSFCLQTLFRFQQKLYLPLTAAPNQEYAIFDCRNEARLNSKFKRFAEKFSAKKNDSVISKERNGFPASNFQRFWGLEINFNEPVLF